MNPLIFGKDNTENIVSIEVKDNLVELFIEKDGKVSSKFIPNVYWITATRPYTEKWERLAGDLHFKYIRKYDNAQDFFNDKRKLYSQDIYSVADAKESAMLYHGLTYFKGMKVSDVSALFFDIESTGIQHNEDSKVLLISNTYVNNGVITRKLFAYDEYESEAEFFDAWCNWVRDINPSVISGYNIYGFDIPYINFCVEKAGTTLTLGRDDSDIRFSKYPSKFRKDGSQDYEYNRCFIYGREIVDLMFVAYHFDFARKYVSYALKQIIKQEGLEIEGRQHYDAGTIWKNYKDPVEWTKIKKYAEHDADDAYSLYKLMIAAYFYLNQSIPKSFQSINYSASGSQINSFLVRSYLQEGHSLPKASDPRGFEGAISLGNPGVYKHVFKVDVASLYPSIMLQYEVYDKEKDPKGNFYEMVDYFTNERLENKKRAKDTGDRYYKELEQAQKIVINSAYGMLGSTGLLFNSPRNAEFVTRTGREILQKCINWATSYDFQIVNADTDSISISDGHEMDEDLRKEILKAINELYPAKIKWEDDGYYPSVLVLKAKNYALKDIKGKVKIKGSALKSSKIEKALKELMDKIVNFFLDGKESELLNIYHNYIKEVYNVEDISRWSSKITVTEAVLNAGRTREKKMLEAIQGNDIQMGNKFWVYSTIDDKLKLQENWSNDHNPIQLSKRVYNTLEIFENILNLTNFPKYHLKNKKVKEALQIILNK